MAQTLGSGYGLQVFLVAVVCEEGIFLGSVVTPVVLVGGAGDLLFFRGVNWWWTVGDAFGGGGSRCGDGGGPEGKGERGWLRQRKRGPIPYTIRFRQRTCNGIDLVLRTTV